MPYPVAAVRGKNFGNPNPLVPLLTSLKIWVEPDDSDGPMVDRHASKTVTAVNSPAFSSDGSGNFGITTSAGSKYWHLGSDSDLQVSDVSFWAFAWLSFNIASGFQVLFSKDNTGAREFGCASLGTGIGIFLGADAKTSYDNFTVATATEYLVQVWQDVPNELIGVQVNNRAPVTASTSGYAFPSPGAAQYRISSHQIGGNYANCNYRFHGMAKKVPSADDRALLFNSGVPLTYAQLTT